MVRCLLVILLGRSKLGGGLCRLDGRLCRCCCICSSDGDRVIVVCACGESDDTKAGIESGVGRGLWGRGSVRRESTVGRPEGGPWSRGRDGSSTNGSAEKGERHDDSEQELGVCTRVFVSNISTCRGDQAVATHSKNSSHCVLILNQAMLASCQHPSPPPVNNQIYYCLAFTLAEV